MESERHLRGDISSEGVKDFSVEHAGVEVDLGVPAVQAVLPLLVHNVLVGIVVGTRGLLPVLLGKEGIKALVQFLEVGVGLVTVFHGLAVHGHSVDHPSVGVFHLAKVVPLECIEKLPVKTLFLEGAFDDVVTLVNGLA